MRESFHSQTQYLIEPGWKQEKNKKFRKKKVFRLNFWLGVEVLCFQQAVTVAELILAKLLILKGRENHEEQAKDAHIARFGHAGDTLETRFFQRKSA